MPTGFRLPPGVYDRTASTSDDLGVPLPCFGVNRFSDCTQYFQRQPLVFENKVVTVSLQRSYRSWRCVECFHIIFVHDLPTPTSIWMCRYSLKDN